MKMAISEARQRYEKRIKGAYRLCNERARLELALCDVLFQVGLPEDQVGRVIADVKRADFKSLYKAIKK